MTKKINPASDWRPAKDPVDRELDAFVPLDQEWEPDPAAGVAKLPPEARAEFDAIARGEDPVPDRDLTPDERARLEHQAGEEVRADFRKRGIPLGDPETDDWEEASLNEHEYFDAIEARYRELVDEALAKPSS